MKNKEVLVKNNGLLKDDQFQYQKVGNDFVIPLTVVITQKKNLQPFTCLLVK